MKDGILTLEKHVRTQVLPKIKDKEDRFMFSWLAEQMDEIGTNSYIMDAKEIMESFEKREIENKYSEQEIMFFLSHPIVSKFIESEILKKNAIVLRKKLNSLAIADNLSQADIKSIAILKEEVDKARAVNDNTVQHFTQFFPTRWDYDNVEYDEETNRIRNNKIKDVIEFLELDTDYNEVLSKHDYEKKDEAIKTINAAKATNDKIAEQLKTVKTSFGGK